MRVDGDFPAAARRALGDAHLQTALGRLRQGFVAGRAAAVARFPEFEAMRDAARDIRDHTLANLDAYLETFEANVVAAGGEVHWCRDADAARATILAILRAANAKTLAKGKSMVGEEIELNEFLEKNGVRPIETDLGEYIIQLRKEKPSHLIAPATHVSKEQIAAAFRAHHGSYGAAKGIDRPLDEPDALLAEARAVLRREFLSADAGMTGANFLVAETGTSVIVTNEGNGDLSQSLPRLHIVLAGIEKVVPTVADAAVLLRVLARSATGQDVSSYTTFSTGPKRTDDLDGPAEYHVVLLDNGRSALLGGAFHDMLRCIRCGACLNHCPVYNAIGGHAYGSVYPGPMGAVLTPALAGIAAAKDLPHASSLCGACESVCPVRIPLPALLRQWRDVTFERGLVGTRAKWGLALWGFFASRPRLYRLAADLAVRVLALKRGNYRRLPGLGAWTRTRDFPAPEGRTFVSSWRQVER
jgi:L-lactate dehydrogenase complex protein LldF